MRITSPVLDAFLKCATKCHLRSLGETGSGNEYAEWVRGHDESYQREAARALQEAVPETERVVAPPAAENLKAAQWRLAVDLVAQTPGRSMDSSLDADAMLTDPELPGTHPSPCPLPAVRGEGGRRPGEGASMKSDARESGPDEKTRGLGSHSPEQLLESRLHAVERVPSEGRGKPAQFVPIRFVFRNKLTKDDRLLLAFDARVLSQMLGRVVSLGKIIHGDDHATLKVKTSALTGEVRKRVEKIGALFSGPAPPDVVLNRHCAECEFQTRCRKIAVEKDDLSLLARMSAKERKKLHSKGIFTVTQLSYTFRVRRRCKRWKSQQPDYSPALKALAIREKKVHVIGIPKIELAGTPVYLDVEGTDDCLYYLIGCRTNARQHSFWAEGKSHERTAFESFLEFLAGIPNPKLICYGRYECRFLGAMRQRYDDLFGRFPDTEDTLQKPLNLIATLYGKVYFPTYGNSLKDVAKHLGFVWTAAGASGLQALVWRSEWESTKQDHLMKRLLEYNAEDCEALELLTSFVTKLCLEDGLSSTPPDCVRVEALKTTGPFLINKGGGALPEFKAINQAAYWDYQRLRVYVRTSKVIKKASGTRNRKVQVHTVRGTLAHPSPSRCPSCDEGELVRHASGWHSLVHDIKFLRHGVKAWVTCHISERCYCPRCQHLVGPSREHPFCLRKYGPTLRAYAVDQLIRLNIPGATVAKSLGDLFHYDLTGEHLSQFKGDFAELYGDLLTELTARITKGSLVHADETAARVVGKPAVVWVLASMEEVVFLYAESREGYMVHEILSGFGGVLVSDFYPVYDAFDCPQQKCLIHLIRDFNDDLHRYPFDLELRQIASEFTSVLKPIVETVDQRGLKARFLARHLSSARRFLTWATRQDFQSETARKYGQRFRKNREKLFTFMSYNGVPWNNNNAENAIRAFAALRERIGGHCTEKSLRHYLTLLSISETCKRRGLCFFDFLCSGEKSLEGFPAHRTSRHRAARPEGVGEHGNDRERKGDVWTNQRPEQSIAKNQALPKVGGGPASPWDRFRPPAADSMTASSKRCLSVERFDNVSFGRVVLAIPALLVSGLWEQTTDLFPEWIDRPFAEMGMFLIAFMFLVQAEQVDALNRVWPTGWNELLCAERLPNIGTLVDLTNLIGQNPGEAGKWGAALATKWISDASSVKAVVAAFGQPCVLLETPAVSSACEQARKALFARGMVEFWFRALDGAPILLLSQTPSGGIRLFWKEWMLPQIQAVAQARMKEPATSTSRESRPLTVVFAGGGVDSPLFRKLQRAGLHVLSYRLTTDDLWPGGTFVEEEVEVHPSHRESVLIAERELSASGSPPVRHVRCILRNGLQWEVISSDRELSLHKVVARIAFEFTASRFWDCLKRNWAVVRSSNAHPAAADTADSKANLGLERFVGAIALVVSRAEAITEQILRENLPRSLECPSVVRDILCRRIDLVPNRGANTLKVHVHVKGDAGEQAAVANLCLQLTATETRFPGTNLRLVYEPLMAPHSA